MNICDEEMLEGAKLNKKVFIVKIFKRKEQKKDFFFF